MNKFESHIIFILYIGWIGSFGSIFANKNTAQPYAKKKKKAQPKRFTKNIYSPTQVIQLITSHKTYPRYWVIYTNY